MLELLTEYITSSVLYILGDIQQHITAYNISLNDRHVQNLV